jgi:hypothetical protein
MKASPGTEDACGAVFGTATRGASSDDGGTAKNVSRDLWEHRPSTRGRVDWHSLVRGLLALHAAFLIPSPTSPPPSDYINLIRTLGWASFVAMDLAVSLTVMLAFVVGATRAEISEAARRGIFIFATIFLAIWLIIGTPFSFGRFP